jgi:predicted RNase H-like nuclease
MPTLTERATDLLAYLDQHATTRAEPVADAPTVADLLAQSRNAHQIYRRSLRHMAGGAIVEGNAAAAADAVAQSARLRAQAELADPTHSDPAWADDFAAKFPHHALIEFYQTEVPRLVPPVAKPVLGFSVIADAG